MLKPKNHQLNNVVAVKTAQYEVVGRVISQDGDEVTLKTPLVVQPMRDNNGDLHIAFVPYVMTAEDDEAFRFEGQVFVPRQDVRDGYVKQTSNLVLPESGLILPK